MAEYVSMSTQYCSLINSNIVLSLLKYRGKGSVAILNFFSSQSHLYVNLLLNLIDFYLLAEDDEEEGVHLVPGSADDAPRTTGQLQGSSGGTTSISSRPSGRVVGIIKRNWHS